MGATTLLGSSAVAVTASTLARLYQRKVTTRSCGADYVSHRLGVLLQKLRPRVVRFVNDVMFTWNEQSRRSVPMRYVSALLTVLVVVLCSPLVIFAQSAQEPATSVPRLGNITGG